LRHAPNCAYTGYLLDALETGAQAFETREQRSNPGPPMQIIRDKAFFSESVAPDWNYRLHTQRQERIKSKSTNLSVISPQRKTGPIAVFDFLPTSNPENLNSHRFQEWNMGLKKSDRPG
jgi:hypothetical protein